MADYHLSDSQDSQAPCYFVWRYVHCVFYSTGFPNLSLKNSFVLSAPYNKPCLNVSTANHFARHA